MTRDSYPVKVGVIGIGNMGWHHARVLSLLKDADLIGVADLNEQKGQLAKDQFQCNWYSDYHQLLSRVDAICIAVPTLLHHQVGLDALKAGVPNGNVQGQITFENQKFNISGSGYHDHNWGNIELQKLFDNWLWFRGTVGQYTIIGYELNTIDSRGGYSIPGLFIADSTGIIYESYGQNGIFTSKENVIKNLYDKNDEALFSKLKIITTENFYLEIEGTEVIENLYLFDLHKTPIIPFLFSFSNIDPYYTRYKSKVMLQLPDETIYKGQGVLEIMDLK